MPNTLMMIKELYLNNNEKALNTSIHIYQQKIGFILFTIITTWPDVTFAASWLARFNMNPGEIHYKTADRTIQYLYGTKGKVLRYGDDNNKACSFICASDALFVNNMLDRKSSQGYIILLFGGTITWKANKQNTIITLSIKAELLALS